jgi:hypothetical protein
MEKIMKQTIVRIEYSEKLKTNEKYFVAKAIVNGKTLVTKTCSWGKMRTDREAYELAAKHANELGKAYNITPTILSMEDILAAYKPLKGSKSKALNTAQSQGSTAVGSDALIEKFGHVLKFKALIKHAIKANGVEKTLEVLAAATALAIEHQEGMEKERKGRMDANMKMAEVIFEAQSNGINMDAPNAEIAEALEVVRARKTNIARINRSLGEYEYNGEKWDGIGSPPASYLAYLKENEDNDIEDLLVTNKRKQQAG